MLSLRITKINYTMPKETFTIVDYTYGERHYDTNDERFYESNFERTKDTKEYLEFIMEGYAHTDRFVGCIIEDND